LGQFDRKGKKPLFSPSDKKLPRDLLPRGSGQLFKGVL
jgi:hypothetical protein